MQNKLASTMSKRQVENTIRKTVSTIEKSGWNRNYTSKHFGKESLVSALDVAAPTNKQELWLETVKFLQQYLNAKDLHEWNMNARNQEHVIQSLTKAADSLKELI